MILQSSQQEEDPGNQHYGRQGVRAGHVGELRKDQG